MTGQSKKASWCEAWINILIGYGVALSAQLIIFPWFGIDITLGENMLIGLAFTVVSLVRSYLLRRVFNYLQVRSMKPSAAEQFCDAHCTWADHHPDCDMQNAISD